ncbi:MAG: glycosyltransferase [Ruminococcus sp.]|nr:glycosyltransferase [Ruminococcus sp.]
MKKLGFVIPWYSDNISGGAETMFRNLTAELHKRTIPLEILTTCAESFNSDWNRNYYRKGLYFDKNCIPVRRFPIRKRNTRAFDSINFRFMNNMPVSYDEEKIFLREMINSNSLYRYMRENSDKYSLFVFTPYMFGTTYYGMQICPEKSVIIPCLHDEPYAHMMHFRKKFPKVAGMVFNSNPEKLLAENLYNLDNIRTLVAGIGMDTSIKANPEDFRQKFRISQPFILYSGRKDYGKNLDTLIRYFNRYSQNNCLKLVLTGGGKNIYAKNVIDLGYVPEQDKFNTMSACEFLCQPSVNESFSLVVMENWLCGRPVLVNEYCSVTKNFVTESNGGLYFGNYQEFRACTDYLLRNKKVSDIMGQNGCRYVKNNFDKNIVTSKYIDFFRNISNES